MQQSILNFILTYFREIKNYIFKHPELKRYFPEETSSFHCVSWVAFNSNGLGSGYEHEEKLNCKRWELGAEILNEELNSHGAFQAIVLFHTPTHIIIEYLRIDQDSPISRRTTIIDGRKDMKEWVGQLDDKQINKRMYPRFRPDDKIKY